MKMKMPARQHSFLLKIIGILLVIINCTTITTVCAAPTPSIVEPFSSEFPLPDYTTNNNNNNNNNNENTNNNNNYYEDSSNEMYYPEIEQNYQSINNWPWFKEYQRNYLKTYNHQRKYRPIVTRNTNKKYVYGGGGSSDDGRDNGINTAVDYDHLRIFDTEPAEELKFSKSITHNLLKNINLKKNNNYAMAPNGYMSLCHFKICNMGRKRNTRHT